MAFRQSKVELWVHDKRVKSLFQTFGTDENHLSFALGYSLSFSPHLLRSIVPKLFGKSIKYQTALVKLQQFGDDKGFTDFEINLDDKFFAIIEAKKGWVLPEKEQLKRYLRRFSKYKRRKRKLVVLSECSQHFVNKNLPKSLYGTPISGISWQSILGSITEVYPYASNREKFVLSQLKNYIQGVVIMENAESNWVYVVSLANGKPSWSELSWKEISDKKGKYFYPVGKGWPKVAPNYIAFRYGGQLRAIHHVEKSKVVEDVHDELREIRKGKLRNQHMLTLGPGFEPRKVLPNGNIWSNGRLWCMLDTLFTARSIKEASQISNKREKKLNG